MGGRYASILRYLGEDFEGIDKGDAIPNKKYTGILVASSTDSHAEIIETFHPLGLPILCEKPITKNRDELSRILRKGPNLCMVNQYAYMLHTSHIKGPTFYDYWNSGKDGPGWDCINIIGLAKDRAQISNKSPIWKCQINGHELNIKHMDYAYCRMIEDWLRKPAPTLDYIDRAHERVFQEQYYYD